MMAINFPDEKRKSTVFSISKAIMYNRQLRMADLCNTSKDTSANLGLKLFKGTV